MEPRLTFIVRFYRQTGLRLTGVVEDTRSGRRMPFSSVEELWNAISRAAKAAGGDTQDNEMKTTGRTQMQRTGKIASWILLAAVAWFASGAMAQSTSIKTEYLMTYVAMLDPPYAVDNTLLIVNVQPGGWAKGPKINGTFIAPGGDWLRVMPSGALRLDVRATLKTDDGALIFISYNGIIQHSAESAEKLGKGELLTTKDIPYFITAPTFQTSSEKYAWLNSVQLVNKLVEVKLGEGGYVKYDVFILR